MKHCMLKLLSFLLIFMICFVACDKETEKIDEQLIELIKEKLVLGSSWGELEQIKFWNHAELKDETEIAKDIDYEDASDYYFDIDNDNIKDKIRIIPGSAISWCELYWGQDNGNFIRGNLNGGYYDTLSKEADETEEQIGTLEFISYKGKNYIIELNSANADRINRINIYFYMDTDLIEKISLTKNVIETICEVEQTSNSTSDAKNEEEGKKLLKNYDEVAYPNVCFGTAEIEIDGEQIGVISHHTQCDINNDGTEEICLKCNNGGLGENFYYEINGENNYLDKYGLTYEEIGELKGFWIDKVDEKNVLKVVSYYDEKYYFRCYILEWTDSIEIFRMCCYPKYEVLVSR